MRIPILIYILLRKHRGFTVFKNLAAPKVFQFAKLTPGGMRTRRTIIIIYLKRKRFDSFQLGIFYFAPITLRKTPMTIHVYSPRRKLCDMPTYTHVLQAEHYTGNIRYFCSRVIINSVELYVDPTIGF